MQWAPPQHAGNVTRLHLGHVGKTQTHSEPGAGGMCAETGSLTRNCPKTISRLLPVLQEAVRRHFLLCLLSSISPDTIWPSIEYCSKLLKCLTLVQSWLPKDRPPEPLLSLTWLFPCGVLWKEGCEELAPATTVLFVKVLYTCRLHWGSLSPFRMNACQDCRPTQQLCGLWLRD